MTKQSNDAVVIKKYANRRLYNTGTSTYVTLEDLAKMVKRGEDFAVSDAKTGEDITRSVLTQIIFDAEAKGQNLLPITFLRQLIRFYDDSIQHLVPPYLDHALAALSSNRDKFLPFGGAAIGGAAFGAIEEQARRNLELFHKSMRMFMPLAPAASDDAARSRAAAADEDQRPLPEPSAPDDAAGGPTRRDFEELRAQFMAMQARLDQLTPDAAAASEAALAAVEEPAKLVPRRPAAGEAAEAGEQPPSGEADSSAAGEEDAGPRHQQAAGKS